MLSPLRIAISGFIVADDKIPEKPETQEIVVTASRREALLPNYTLVMINGVPLLTDHMHTGQNIEMIPPESIERIEIMRGAASAQYGADAIGGIVNIITHKKTDKASGQAEE